MDWSLAPAAETFLSGQLPPMVHAADMRSPDHDVFSVIRIADGRCLDVQEAKTADEAVAKVARHRHVDVATLCAVTHVPEVSLTQDEAAVARASLLGSPIVDESCVPAADRDRPVEYGPEVRRLVDRDGRRQLFQGRLSAFRRQFPDQVEARRRSRAGVPLMGWPPKRMFDL